MDDARLFLALWPDSAIRAALAARRDGWTWPRGATPVHSARLHLTLHFIGHVPRARIDALRQALAVSFTPFELEFGVPVLWPHGIAVLAPTSEPAALIDLWNALGAALLAAGLPPEPRAYKPHVTIARRATGAVVPRDDSTSCPPIRWPVSAYALMESTTGADGGYTVLQHYRATI